MNVNKKIFFIIISILLNGFIIMSCASKSSVAPSEDEDEEEANDATVTCEATSTEGEKVNDEKSTKKDDTANNIDEKAIQNTNQNKNRKTVVIDPGHGGNSNLQEEKQSPDSNILKIKDGGGCVGTCTNVREAVVTLKVSMKLKALLEANNINVVMTRTDDSKGMGNIERAEIGNKNNASLSIRIHCDSADSATVKGATMLVPGKVGYAKDISDISQKYGKTILNSLVSKAKMNNRGLMVSNDMTGFNWSKVPVVLIELGFMSNPNEDRLLVSDDYQNKLAEGLCDGILKIIKEN